MDSQCWYSFTSTVTICLKLIENDEDDNIIYTYAPNTREVDTYCWININTLYRDKASQTQQGIPLISHYLRVFVFLH